VYPPVSSFVCICSFSSSANAGTHFKVIIVSDEFDYIESDAGRREMVDVVLAEQLRGPSHSHQVQAVKVNTLAMTPAEHVRIMSKYDTPNQWIAMVLESSSDESPTRGNQ
jgi:stress-induced morphogen